MTETRAARAQVKFWTGMREEARGLELGSLKRYRAACDARRAARTEENEERFWIEMRAYEFARELRMERQHQELLARQWLANCFG